MDRMLTLFDRLHDRLRPVTLYVDDEIYATIRVPEHGRVCWAEGEAKTAAEAQASASPPPPEIVDVRDLIGVIPGTIRKNGPGRMNQSTLCNALSGSGAITKGRVRHRLNVPVAVAFLEARLASRERRVGILPKSQETVLATLRKIAAGELVVPAPKP